MRPLRPCLGIPAHLAETRGVPRNPGGSGGNPGGCPRLARGSRCPDCQAVVDTAASRAKRQRRPEMAADTTRRAEAVDAWVATHGHWCPGWGRPAHYSEDLTADHVRSVASGGSETGRLTVLCRSCNSAKGSR